MRSPSEPMIHWLALDIGGANIKAAHSSGHCRSLPFELWKQPGELPRVLKGLTSALPRFDRLALTMTAELCDCFATKADGVQAVLDAVLEVTAEPNVRVWGLDGRLHDVASTREKPRLAAAANWLALACLSARLLPEGPSLLIDVGSTTTDLVPLRDGQAVPQGRTDPERLQKGELVYAGTRRTPVCALATSLPWRGEPTGLAAEVFATTLDVYLTLGRHSDDPIDRATADGRPATTEAARDRLARMVCADHEEFSPDDAQDLAEAAHQALLERLRQSAKRACQDLGPLRGAIISGSGEFLARCLADRLLGPAGQVISLREAWGPAASTAGCAYALAILAAEGEAGALSAEPSAS